MKSSLRLSVSSWAVHGVLGQTFAGRPDDASRPTVAPAGPGTLPLLNLPARLAALGFGRMELCHFHLPSREPAYLADLRAALSEAGVELWSLLVDDGDLTHPEHHARDAAWIGDWVDTAGALGATCARAIAGKQAPTGDTLARSRGHLSDLARRAAGQNVRLMTENWHALLPAPGPVHALLDGLDQAVGLCVDTGNWSGPTKYDDLAAIFPRGESCHARCEYLGPDKPDLSDFERCLDLARGADYAGPFTLVAAGPGDVWESLAFQRDVLAGYVSA